MSLFTRPIHKTVSVRVHPKHKKLKRETYRFYSFPSTRMPWVYAGELTNGTRVIGHVRAPRHLTLSEEYHAFLSWVVNDLVEQYGPTVSIEKIK